MISVDRRTSPLQHQALTVEIGVNYLRTIGISQSVSYLTLQGVLPDVIVRVTGPCHTRRKTHWESSVDEAALRRALGARPLLAEHAQAHTAPVKIAA